MFELLGDENRVKIIDFGNALYCVHGEVKMLNAISFLIISRF